MTLLSRLRALLLADVSHRRRAEALALCDVLEREAVVALLWSLRN